MEVQGKPLPQETAELGELMVAVAVVVLLVRLVLRGQVA
jgi:hypothetical protein